MGTNLTENERQMRQFVMGDIHGGHKAMLQCLQRSSFDYDNDLLIQLGDVVDGYPQAYECVEELLKIKNLITIKGNHDDWFNEFINTDFHPYYWNFGGKGTLISYIEYSHKGGKYFLTTKGFKASLEAKDIPLTHKEFFRNQKDYHIDDRQRCFVHAGFNRSVSFDGQPIENFYWDRSLWSDAISLSANNSEQVFSTVTKFNEIYIGHTPTTKYGSDRPITAFNITNLDTGASNKGRLTIMDVDTKQYWQSDLLAELYKGYS